MPRRSLRRLAGCIGIELLLALAGAVPAWPVDPDYRAGTGYTDHVKAVAIEDRHGERVVFVEADFAITHQIADLAAVQLAKAYGLDRPSLVFRGTGDLTAHPQDLIVAVTEALGSKQPAHIRRTAAGLSISAARCVATLFPIAFAGCAPGAEVRGFIRAAFQMVEPAHGLLQRGETPLAYPVQAVGLGKDAAILALGGDAPVAEFAAGGLIAIAHANGNAAMPADPAIRAAVRQVLARVGR
jgi:hypothetical protein